MNLLESSLEYLFLEDKNARFCCWNLKLGNKILGHNVDMACKTISRESFHILRLEVFFHFAAKKKN